MLSSKWGDMTTKKTSFLLYPTKESYDLEQKSIELDLKYFAKLRKINKKIMLKIMNKCNREAV